MPKINMRSIAMSMGAAVVFAGGAAFFSLASPDAAAQGAPLYINAVDLDIAPDQMKENGANSVKEPGCREFNIAVQASNPNHVFLYEVYDNEASLAAHRNTEHFKKFAAITAKMVTGRNVRPMSAVALNAKAH